MIKLAYDGTQTTFEDICCAYPSSPCTENRPVPDFVSFTKEHFLCELRTDPPPEALRPDKQNNAHATQMICATVFYRLFWETHHRRTSFLCGFVGLKDLITLGLKNPSCLPRNSPSIPVMLHTTGRSWARRYLSYSSCCGRSTCWTCSLRRVSRSRRPFGGTIYRTPPYHCAMYKLF